MAKPITALVLIFAATMVIASPASAQEPARLDVGVAAGPAPYDLSGTGTLARPTCFRS